MVYTSKKIINTYMTITGLYTLSASLIWGINTLFLLSAGLNILQVFTINAIFSASMAVFEIPTGVFADTLGRKMSFLASTIVLTLGTTGYVLIKNIENNFIIYCAISAVIGLAFTFYSGAVEAWLVDALNHIEYKGSLDGVFTKGMIVNNIAMLIGTLAGGFLGTLNLSAPYILRASIQLFVLVVAIIFMKDIGYTKRALKINAIPKEMKNIASESVQYGIKNKSTRGLIGMTFIFSSFMMWAWYAWQPYFLELYGDTSAVWVAGFVAAGVSVSQIIGGICLGQISKFLKKRTSIFTFAVIIQCVTLVAVGITNSFVWAVTCFFIFFFTVGLVAPTKQSYMHQIIPSSHRATIVSFDSLMGSASSFGGQLGFGYISDRYSIALGYIISGVLNITVLPVVLLLRRRKDTADIIDKELHYEKIEE